MNFADATKSKRLQDVLKVLKDKKRHSTLELIQTTGRCAINSIVAEIRQNGYKVECKREGNAWYYKLA